MSEVWVATDTVLDRRVAVKLLKPTLAADPVVVERLRREAVAAARLNHPGIVSVYDTVQDGGRQGVVMELIAGRSLRAVLDERKQLRVIDTVAIGRAVAAALQAAHRAGLVHRDVKPGNILITDDGRVKLADFGIAKAVGKSERSATGVIKGKFAYMSPEQSAARPLDARSDLFSVGTLLYLLTTGKKPFDGATDTDVIMQVRRAKPEKPSTVVRDMNVDVERVINRALRADPGKRWQSAEQMADKLDAILIKLGQPSGPAPLKRWLETLSARDGAKPPVPDPALVANDPSIAVSLGSLELELEEVPQPTFVEPDRGTNVETRPLRYRAPTPPPQLFEQPAAPASPPRPSVVRFKRWLRRMSIRAAIVVLALGGASYFAWPHLPAWIKRPITNWVSGVSVEFGPKSH
jgi:serine/threonine protein kinase